MFIASCWVHSMLSVDAVCAFAFSLGHEGLTSDRLELRLMDRMGLGPVSE
jgi:hypothetical protein